MWRPTFPMVRWSCMLRPVAMADETIAEHEAAFHRGLDAYRAGCHFDAFDIWTQVHEDEKNETNRRFLSALLQVTNAMHKVRHNAELRGSLHLLERALIKLDVLPDVYGGIDLAKFRDATRHCLAEIARLLSHARKDLELSFVPPLESVGPGPVLEPRVAPVSLDPSRLLHDGLDAYRGGRFYEAHELWEEYRRGLPEEGPTRELLKGMILVATAMHKLHRAKSPSGASQLLELALDKLHDVPEGTSGMAVEAFVREVTRVQEEVELLEKAQPPNTESSHVPEISLL